MQFATFTPPLPIASLQAREPEKLTVPLTLMMDINMELLAWVWQRQQGLMHQDSKPNFTEVPLILV